MPVYKSDQPTKDGRKFYFKVRYNDLNGKIIQYKSKKYSTKREAEKAEASFLVNIGEFRGGKKTFADVASELLEYQKDRVRPQSYDKLVTMVEFVVNDLGKIKIDQITSSQYKKFYNHVKDTGFSAKHSNQILATAKRLVNFSNKRFGVTSTVPFMFDNIKDVNKSEKNVDFYTPEEFEMLLSVVDDIRYTAFFTVMFYCGFRPGENNALTWKDIDFEKGTISINKTINTRATEYTIGPPKTAAGYRTIPVSKKVLDVLSELHTFWKNADSYDDSWWVYGGYKPFPNNSMQKRKNGYIDKYNALQFEIYKQQHQEDDPEGKKFVKPLKQIRLHDLRHSCASFLINELHIPITSVSKYLGHESPDITLKVYSHFYQEKLNDIADGIDKFGT